MEGQKIYPYCQQKELSRRIIVFCQLTESVILELGDMMFIQVSGLFLTCLVLGTARVLEAFWSFWICLLLLLLIYSKIKSLFPVFHSFWKEILVRVCLVV